MAVDLTGGFTLALGGGGGRGSAHIGVVRALEELGLRPTIVVGTSAGAVVGAGYAAGLSAAEMTALAHGTDVWGTVGRRTRQALFDLQPLLERYVAQLGMTRIQDMPMPFVAAAFDLDRGRLVGIDRGPLVDALLRSAAIPIVFRPQANGSHLIVDGGLWESVPVSLARERASMSVVGVEIMPNKPTITEHGPLSWSARTGPKAKSMIRTSTRSKPPPAWARSGWRNSTVRWRRWGADPSVCTSSDSATAG